MIGAKEEGRYPGGVPEKIEEMDDRLDYSTTDPAARKSRQTE